MSTSFTQNETSAPATPTSNIEIPSANNASATLAADRSAPPVDVPIESEPNNESPDAEPSANTFMSFEDWKEMMLRQTGQDPQDLRSRKSNPNRAQERVPPDLGHFGLGEEEEISLDFDNYLPKQDQDHLAPERNSEGSDVTEYNYGDPSVSNRDYRSKDAGKTCKERFSYSSFDAGATVLKTGPGTKNAKAILVEHKDSYMLLECSRQSKYVIVELSDDILIDTVVLANFEFFSSMIRHFRVSVSDRYPVKIDRWRTIGTFEARNSRDIQPFLVENPQIWAKYVRLEFLTHYGNEYYCPVSLLRIHGSRMLDSWKEFETGSDDGADEDHDHDHDHNQRATISGNEVAEEGDEPPIEVSDDSPDSTPQTGGDHEPPGQDAKLGGYEHAPEAHSGHVCSVSLSTQLLQIVDTCPANFSILVQTEHCHDCSAKFSDPAADQVSIVQPHSSGEQPTTSISQTSSPASDTPMAASSNTSSEQSDASPSRSATQQKSSTSQTSAKEATNATISATSNTKTTTPTSPASKRGAGASGGSPPPPTVQEGFFNAITKRLHNVETNLTLSLQYLEDQSRHLQEAFHKAEQKQLLKVTNFLENLNQTVFSELRGIRTQYDQIWQSTVIALESQREQSERDIVALSTRLNVLADEVVFQKRMAIVQAVLLLCCLFLVIFSRGVPIPYLAPLLEQNSNTGLYAASPPDLGTKPHSLGQDSALGKSAAARPSESTHLPTTHVVSGRPGLLRTNMPESEGQLDSYQEGGLSPPATPGPQTPDSDELVSTMGIDMPNTLPHRVAGYQTSHSRKPLPALPEHPSPPS